MIQAPTERKVNTDSSIPSHTYVSGGTRIKVWIVEIAHIGGKVERKLDQWNKVWLDRKQLDAIARHVEIGAGCRRAEEGNANLDVWLGSVSPINNHLHLQLSCCFSTSPSHLNTTMTDP